MLHLIYATNYPRLRNIYTQHLYYHSCISTAASVTAADGEEDATVADTLRKYLI